MVLMLSVDSQPPEVFRAALLPLPRSLNSAIHFRPAFLAGGERGIYVFTQARHLEPHQPGSYSLRPNCLRRWLVHFRHKDSAYSDWTKLFSILVPLHLLLLQ